MLFVSLRQAGVWPVQKLVTSAVNCSAAMVAPAPAAWTAARHGANRTLCRRLAEGPFVTLLTMAALHWTNWQSQMSNVPEPEGVVTAWSANENAGFLWWVEHPGPGQVEVSVAIRVHGVGGRVASETADRDVVGAGQQAGEVRFGVGQQQTMIDHVEWAKVLKKKNSMHRPALDRRAAIQLDRGIDQSDRSSHQLNYFYRRYLCCASVPDGEYFWEGFHHRS